MTKATLQSRLLVDETLAKLAGLFAHFVYWQRTVLSVRQVATLCAASLAKTQHRVLCLSLSGKDRTVQLLAPKTLTRTVLSAIGGQEDFSESVGHRYLCKRLFAPLCQLSRLSLILKNAGGGLSTSMLFFRGRPPITDGPLSASFRIGTAEGVFAEFWRLLIYSSLPQSC